MNQNMADDQDVRDLTAQLEGLLGEAEKIDREIDETGEAAGKEMNDAEKSVDAAVGELDHTFSDLDQMEADAGNELDKLMLEQVEDSAGE